MAGAVDWENAALGQPNWAAIRRRENLAFMRDVNGRMIPRFRRQSPGQEWLRLGEGLGQEGGKNKSPRMRVWKLFWPGPPCGGELELTARGSGEPRSGLLWWSPLGSGGRCE